MKVKCFLGYYLNPSQIKIKPKHYYFGLVGLDEKQIDKEPFYVDYLYNNRLSKNWFSKLNQAVLNAFKIIFSNHDILFAAFQEGIWILIILRAFGIYRKPIVIWQHRPIRYSSNKFKNIFIKFFYRGCDRLLFFSPKHIDEAIDAKVIDSNKLKLIAFGGDLDYFDRVKHNISNDIQSNNHFVTFGSENRDYKTIINAFENTTHKLDVYTSRIHGNNDYHKFLNPFLNQYSNISINFTSDFRTIFPTLFEIALNSYCVVISVLEKNYTVGLTQLIDSMAMGLPVITNDNPYYPIDVEKEGIGIKIKYGCVSEWVAAINYLSLNPQIAQEMGVKARLLSEKKYNSDNMIRQIKEQFIQINVK